MTGDRASRWAGWWPVLIGLSVLVFLAVFAWRLADERLYADSGYYLVRTIIGNGPHIEHGRWVLLFAEALPIAGVKAGAPMPVLIMLHSFANVAFLAGAMLFAHVVLQDRRALLFLALSQLIGLAHGLFCPVFELYYGVGFIILFHSALSSDHLKGLNRTVLCTLFLLGTLSSHPMAWLLLFGSFLLVRGNRLRPMLAVIIAVTIAFAVVRGLTMSTYESAQFGFLQRLAFPSLWLELFTPAVLAVQVQRILLHYPDVLVLSVFCMVVHWRERDRRSVGLLLAGLLGLYILTGLYLPDPLHDRYREQVDFAFTAWVLIVLMLRLWPVQAWRPALLVMLGACVCFRMIDAERVAPFYEARTQWHRDLITAAREEGLSKAIVDARGKAFGTANEHVVPYWSTGIECLLLSAQDGAQRTVSIITTDDLQCPGVAENLDKLVLRCWDVLEPDALDRHYFNLEQASYEPLPPR